MELLWRLLREESGQDVVEYSLLVAFVALVAAGIIMTTGLASNLTTIWTGLGNAVSNATAACQGAGGC